MTSPLQDEPYYYLLVYSIADQVTDINNDYDYKNSNDMKSTDNREIDLQFVKIIIVSRFYGGVSCKHKSSL